MKLQARIMQVVLIMTMLRIASSAVHVTVRNSLGDGKKMTLHCRSKDDDLGTKEMSPGEEYSWDFTPNVWLSTLFYCTVSQGSVQGFVFDAYKHQRDYRRCKDWGCLWDVFDDGIYFRFTGGDVDLYYDLYYTHT